MKQLQVVANEMLSVYENQTGEKFVNARELHEQMLVGKVFAAWMQERIEKYGFINNEDYFLTVSKTGKRQNVTKHEYWLTLDTAKEIAMVQNNEMGRAIRKYFIEVEKRFRQQTPRTELQILQGAINQLVAAEQRMMMLETQVVETNTRVDNMSQIIALNTVDWRRDVHKIINKIAVKQGGYDMYSIIRNESYELLERRAGANLGVRLSNKQKNMAVAGATKTQINKVSKLDVIAEDKRLIEIYLAVVKEMAIKYQVDKVS
ncbi:antA/AntB antirepressor family protein [Bacillus sp. NPDC077411]|uniref:antA/AntB antirepressor family protein n=1 Tax=Bacillus sp. NPDC077411 TaxID=3363947 RepID=UPI0037CC4E7E